MFSRSNSTFRSAAISAARFKPSTQLWCCSRRGRSGFLLPDKTIRRLHSSLSNTGIFERTSARNASRSAGSQIPLRSPAAVSKPIPKLRFLRFALRKSSSDHLKKLERSEEHTSELQSLAYLVCRLLLEKK